MPLTGTLSAMPLPDLLQWLASSKKTGTLRVERNKVVKTFVLKKGRVVGCSSDDPPERIGHFLLSRGKINEEQLREALRSQETTKKHLGMTLVGMGALSEEDLATHLAAKAEEMIYSVFDWEEAVFRFDEALTDVPNVLPVSLPVEEILLRGLKRYDEMRMIREVFNDPGIVLRQTPRLPPHGVFHNKMARKLYESIDGERTVAEILLIAHGSEYLVTKFLFELYRGGFLEIVGVRNTEPEPIATAAGSPAAVLEEAPSRARPEEAPLAAEPGDDVPRDAADEVVFENVEPVVAGAVALPSEPPTASPEAPADDPADEVAVPAPAARAEIPPSTSEQPVAPPPPVIRRAHPTPNPVPRGVSEREGGLDVQLATARHQMSCGEHEKALAILDTLYQTHPQDESLRRLTAEAEAAFIEKAYRHYVPTRKIPVLTRPVVETENFSPGEFYLLSRIDGTWDVKSIIQITPLREVEAIRMLKRMRERGIIDLRDPE